MSKRLPPDRSPQDARADQPPDVRLLAALEALETLPAEDRSQIATRLLEAMAAQPAHAGEFAARALELVAISDDREVDLGAAGAGLPRTPGAQGALRRIFDATDLGSTDSAGATHAHATDRSSPRERVAERPVAYDDAVAGAQDEAIARATASDDDNDVTRHASAAAEPAADAEGSQDGAGDERNIDRIERMAAALNLPRIVIVAALVALEQDARRAAGSK